MTTQKAYRFFESYSLTNRFFEFYVTVKKQENKEPKNK
ncbi:MAG: hypothetical protein ACI9XO_001312 [Paraglaciecola sp.]|jgi:hypothetical protein